MNNFTFNVTVHEERTIENWLDSRPRLPTVPVSRSLRRQRGLARRPAVQCGTISGYESHRTRGETPCDPCRAARAAYLRDLRAEKRAVS